MPHRTELADALRAAGLRVAEVDGWRTRGSSTFTPRVVIAHHTAGAATGNMPSLNILVKGRSDLPGPLCQVGLGRDGTAYVVAAGRANHAGSGGWRGVAGNSNAWGIEAENTGRGQAWTSEQLRAYPIICAVLCKLASVGASAVCGHREWTPRKIDPAGIDMAWLRNMTGAILGAAPTPPTPPEEDDMPPHPIAKRADAYTMVLRWYALHAGRDGSLDPGGMAWWLTQLPGRDTDYDVDMLELMFADLASRR